MHRLWPILVCACGRVGFDSAATDDAKAGGDGNVAVTDGAPNDNLPAIACADVNLGSALGPNVASGTTAGQGDQYSGCSGDGPDLSFGWFAPETAAYRIDLCASPSGYDSTLYVRDGTCNGVELACDDDGCGAAGPSRLTVNLTAGQAVVIVVDGDFSGDQGTYQLAITKL